VADLAARLRAAGHPTDLITTTPGDAQEGVVRLDVPNLPGAGIALTPALGPATTRALARGDYDVVHAHASVVSPAAYAAVRAARRLGLPCVLTFHSLLHTTARVLAAADALTRWARAPLVLTGVSALVAAPRRGALPQARVSVLPNAADVAWWRGAPRLAERGALSALVPPRARGEVRIVTAMRLTRKKRTRDLLDALHALHAAREASGAPVRLIVAGDGPDHALLARGARTAGDGGALLLLGWQPRTVLRALYADADLFVLPAEHESFGIAALEARAAGLPVVGRADSGLADFVHDGIDGVLARDPAALAAAVGALAADPARRAALAARTRAAPPHAFDWPRVVARHEALYAELSCAGRAMPAPQVAIR
jgi:glycosyltransferase involved in cell wall biosynthesis